MRAAHAPGGDGELFDLETGEVGVGEEVGFEAMEELVEALFGLAREEDGLSAETMGDGIERGAAFALGRDRPAGERAVGAGSEGSLQVIFDAFFHLIRLYSWAGGFRTGPGGK